MAWVGIPDMGTEEPWGNGLGFSGFLLRGLV